MFIPLHSKKEVHPNCFYPASFTDNRHASSLLQYCSCNRVLFLGLLGLFGLRARTANQVDRISKLNLTSD